MRKERPNFRDTFAISRLMCEQVLIPYLDLTDLVKFTGLNREFRVMLTFNHPKCVKNIWALLNPRIRAVVPSHRADKAIEEC